MSILMIGTQRSGSNLMRLMLNQIPMIEAPHPPHILQRLMPLMSAYEDLSDASTFAQLVDDVCRLIELNPVPWEGVVLDRQDITNRCTQNTLVAVFSAVYDVLAETRGAETWCCKSLANVHYVPEINEYLPKAKYLYLYRDGRDVAVSFKKAVIGQKHFYHIAQDWAKAQRAALKMREKFDENQFFSISYESLTGSPEESLKALCKFLEVEYSPSMMSFHESSEAKNTASSSSLWNNVTKPIMNQNTKKFLTQASEEDVKIFELVAGDVLDALGYERTQTSPNDVATFSAEEIAQFDAENQRLKAERKETMDAEDLGRRERQAALLQAIKDRRPLTTVS
ncbi:sulfotransferase [Leptolyngbyaceae cyanobacterium CCMR0082]|uniref:Sulfotransferase n=1 Tax=Adonisia turfae CCMR0082 TaxID=2304604 RepID=A0A6M0SGL9_9CYAN|nr:sulfotransferase [Adonisia turfae]MDV3350007.1 sulfotransferase [Leptothoe sp. LEGE 181152]NEZ67625.1 sulfotransferase [Adonisia turfae CCMR0082]